jgi:hypothetical protein
MGRIAQRRSRVWPPASPAPWTLDVVRSGPCSREQFADGALVVLLAARMRLMNLQILPGVLGFMPKFPDAELADGDVELILDYLSAPQSRPH